MAPVTVRMLLVCRACLTTFVTTGEVIARNAGQTTALIDRPDLVALWGSAHHGPIIIDQFDLQE